MPPQFVWILLVNTNIHGVYATQPLAEAAREEVISEGEYRDRCKVEGWLLEDHQQ